MASSATWQAITIPVDKGVLLFQRREGGCWYLQVFQGGLRLRKSLQTRDRNTALMIARQRAEELLTVKSGVIVMRDPLIDDLMEGYRKHIDLRNQPSTRRLNMDNLERIFAYVRGKTEEDVLKVSHFTPDVLEAYMRQRHEDGLVPATINRERSSLHSFFRRAARRRLIRLNPVELVDPLPDVRRRLPPTLTSAQAKSLLLEAAKPVEFHGPGGKGLGNSRERYTPLHDIILFALNTGARLGEIIYLEWKDIDFDSGLVKIVNKPEHQVKDREDRVVRANTLLLGMLRHRHDLRGPEDRWVFPSTTGSVLDRRNLLREFKNVAKRIGLGSMNYLVLRHTALTALARTGAPLFVLREVAGHASARTTERYYIGNMGGDSWAVPVLGA